MSWGHIFLGNSIINEVSPRMFIHGWRNTFVLHLNSFIPSPERTYFMF